MKSHQWTLQPGRTAMAPTYGPHDRFRFLVEGAVPLLLGHGDPAALAQPPRSLAHVLRPVGNGNKMIS